MEQNTIIYLCGFHSLLFAAFHAAFWRLFNWQAQLKTLSKANRGIMQILNLRLIYVFVFTSFLCFVFTEDLYMTSIGKAFMIGMSIFWMGRIIEQFVFLRINHWLVHLLSLLFVIGVILFLLPSFLDHTI